MPDAAGKKVLVIGGGGREHALAWKLAQSPRVEKIFVAPGNAGTAGLVTAGGMAAENVPIDAADIPALVSFAESRAIDLAVVGPDDPLARGAVDAFEAAGRLAFGPRKAAARLEASKAFAKDFMTKHGIPTARFRTFTDFETARAYIKKDGAPIVVKASGLALGKGVTVANTEEEAEHALRGIMVDKIFGDAGAEVVVEEFLEGPEISIHVISDGTNYRIFPAAQDHKPAFENDEGPNTGGMGTIAPVPWVTAEHLREIEERIVRPALRGMAEEGAPFRGLLYPGLKMTKDGPKALEFNARFGDPETQSYMRLLKSDLYDLFEASAQGALGGQSIEWHPGAACCIALASGGYPGPYEKGKVISGIAQAEAREGIVVFHAGTKSADGTLLTNGGRVLGVTAVGATLKSALARAYEAARLIHFEAMRYRKDIGRTSLEHAGGNPA